MRDIPGSAWNFLEAFQAVRFVSSEPFADRVAGGTELDGSFSDAVFEGELNHVVADVEFMVF
mgnify:CR=1 FL=1